MSFSAKTYINTGTKLIKPGDVVTGLSSLEIDRLLKIGAVESLNLKVVSNALDDSIDQFDAFEKIINNMLKRELTAYANQLELEVDDKLKNDELKKLIFNSSKENGIDISAFEDQHLYEFANLIGIKQIEQKDRDQVLDAIEDKFA